MLDDPLEDSLYLVFEWVEQGAVLTLPTGKPLSEQRAWSVFRDALLGLEYCELSDMQLKPTKPIHCHVSPQPVHYQHIIHSDLKPDNLLVDKNGRVQIADLGVCNEFDGQDASMSNVSTPGTPAFRAPETLQTGQHSYNGRAVDVWALGVTLYALVFGQVPFVGDNVPAVYERIRADQLRFPDESGHCTADAQSAAPAALISEPLRQLIVRMLHKDPAQRATVPQIKTDAWVTSNGEQPLPSEEENCCQLVDVSEDEIQSVVKSIPKLDTLILIKNMLKKHSFQNPYVVGGGGRPATGGLSPSFVAGQSSRAERFLRAGRSNSAPGAYHGMER